jgi:hypothetical protein
MDYRAHVLEKLALAGPTGRHWYRPPSIDASRVATTGFSCGGSMSYELACDRADKFRAALLLDPGTLSGTSSSTCKTPIAVFLSHGVDDQTLSYSGGLGILNIFTQVNGCTAMTPPHAPDERTHVHLVHRMLGRTSRPRLQLRQRRGQLVQREPEGPLPDSQGSRANHELSAPRILGFHRAVLSPRTRPLASLSPPGPPGRAGP